MVRWRAAAVMALVACLGAAADPESAALSRAETEIERNNIQGAIEALQEAAAVAPASLQALQSLAELYRRQGRYAEAAQTFERAAARVKEESDDAVVFGLDYGWFLATCPDAKFRDGPRAVASAERALRGLADAKLDSLNHAVRSLQIFEVMAAGHAEAGAFEKAAAAARLAASSRQSLLKVFPTRDFAKKDFDERVAGYKAGKPWRDTSQ